jgi:hypothetical protein
MPIAEYAVTEAEKCVTLMDSITPGRDAADIYLELKGKCAIKDK